MQLTQAFQDKEIRRLLFGDGADLAEAFTQVDAYLRARFVKGARDRLPWLRPEDLADAWQETLKDLLEAVRVGAFDPDREFVPWLWTIFIRRIFDHLRRQRRYQAMLDGLRKRLIGSAVGDLLARMDEEERRALLERVRTSVGTLPERQRIVVQTFVDHFPATEDMEALRQRVSEVTGGPETRAGVARALQEARRKVAGALRTESS